MTTSKILSFESCYKNIYCVFRTPLNSVAGLVVLGISLPSIGWAISSSRIDGIIIGAFFSVILSGYCLRKKASNWATFSSLLLLTNIGLSLALVIMALAYKYSIVLLGDGSNIASGLTANGVILVGVYGINFFKNYRLAPRISVVGIMAVCTILTGASIIFFDLHDFKWGQLYFGEQEGLFTGIAVSLVLLVVFWRSNRKTDSVSGTSLTLNFIGFYLLLLALTIFITSSDVNIEHSQFVSAIQVVLMIVCTIGGIYLLMRFKPWGSLPSLVTVFGIGSGAISFLFISLILFQVVLDYDSAHLLTLGGLLVLLAHILIIVTVIYIVGYRWHIFNSILAAFHIIWKKLSCFPIASFTSTSYRIVIFLVINIIYLAYFLYPVAFACNLSQSRILSFLADHNLYKVDSCRFVHTTLRDTYYWYDKVPPIYFSDYSSPELLLKKMKYHKIDKWSYLTNMNPSKYFSKRDDSDLGFLIECDKEHNIWVSFVYDDSSADKAGVKRGFKVLTIAGHTIEEIRKNDLWDLFYRGKYGGSLEMGFEDLSGNIRETILTYKYFKKKTVYNHSYFNLNGKIIGYLFLESFGYTSFEELSSVFDEFKKKGVDELVLDLRYNNGGSLDASRYLASLIAGKEAKGQVFQSLIHNDKYKDDDHSIYFSQEKNALNLKRVVVITTDCTCSASEALINGLKPFIDVVQIGSTTCGKPAGTTPVEFDNLDINVINFLVVNAEGEGGYYDGLKPTYPAEDDLMKPLGDPNGASLKKALHYLEYGA